MKTYQVWFLLSCLGSMYAFCYTLYCWLFLGVEEETTGFGRTWYQVFCKALGLKKSQEEKNLSTLITILLCMVTLLVGLWMFVPIRQYSNRARKSSGHTLVCMCALLLVLLGMLVIQTDILVLAMLVLSAVVCGYYFASKDLTPRQLFWTMLKYLLVISFPWEYMRLYKHQVAVKYHYAMKTIPAECPPSVPTLWGSFTTALREMFAWTSHDDKCIQYHKALLVEPFWEVTPVAVFSSLVTKCVTQPLEEMASSLGLSYQLLFKHLPVQWQPVVMIQIIVLSILLIIMLCGYKIRLPWILHIEPAEPNTGKLRVENSSMRAICS